MAGTRVLQPFPFLPGWSERAACLDVSVHSYYPENSTPPPVAALEACRACEVRAECLSYGLADRWGWFGGISPQGRVALVAQGWAITDPLPPVGWRPPYGKRRDRFVFPQ